MRLRYRFSIGTGSQYSGLLTSHVVSTSSAESAPPAASCMVKAATRGDARGALTDANAGSGAFIGESRSAGAAMRAKASMVGCGVVVSGLLGPREAKCAESFSEMHGACGALRS